MSLRKAPGRPPGQARRPFAFRPRLLNLEDRYLPSTVTNLLDAGAGSLRQAILDTPTGGTVDFQPGLTGTITLTSGELLINQDLTIAGPGADVLTVSGNHASRVFDIAAGFTVDISGLTVADGNVADSDNGGGIFNAGTLTLTDSTLTGNYAGGGGIWNQGPLMTVTASNLHGNAAIAGGGIYNDFSPLTITGSTFSGNAASNLGGAIVNVSSPLTVTASTLSGNTGLNDAGGIFSGIGSNLTVTASTLSGNAAPSGSGGGIFNAGTATITESTLSSNTANAVGVPYYGGGGIYNIGLAGSASLTIAGSTLSGNSAANAGGGILTFGGQAITVPRNTMIARNTAGSSPDVYIYSGHLRSQGHNLIGDGSGGSGYDPTDLVGTASNPIDPKLGPLADNGGPTLTRALLPGSPAIDAGDNTGAPMWDQRGAPFRRIVNGIIDIGAFEVQARGNGGPAHQPSPDPVPVQVLGMPAGALSGQPPALPADSTPLPRTGAPDGQAGRQKTGPVPAPTAGGQQAAETFFADAGNGQMGDALGSLGGIPIDLPTLGLPRGS